MLPSMIGYVSVYLLTTSRYDSGGYLLTTSRGGYLLMNYLQEAIHDLKTCMIQEAIYSRPQEEAIYSWTTFRRLFTTSDMHDSGGYLLTTSRGGYLLTTSKRRLFTHYLKTGYSRPQDLIQEAIYSRLQDMIQEVSTTRNNAVECIT